MEGRDPTEFTLREKATFIAQGVMSGKIFELAKPANVSLWKELSSYFAQPEVKAKLAREVEGVSRAGAPHIPDGESRLRTTRLSLLREIRPANYAAETSIESMQALSGIAPILVILAPYIYGFHSQAPSRKWLRKIFREMTGEIPPALAKSQARLVHRHARRRQRRRHHHSQNDGGGRGRRRRTDRRHFARRDSQIDDIPIKNFRPIGEFELPEYELQKLSFPPILQMLDYIQREQFTEIIISTPGPIGLTALARGEDAEPANERHLSHRFSAIHPHPDRGQLSRKPGLELHALVLRPARHRFRELGAISPELDRARIRSGETEDSPARARHRTVQSRPARSGILGTIRQQCNGAVRLLYVGRISKEKDLDVLAAAYRQLREEGLPVQLFRGRPRTVLAGAGRELAGSGLHRLPARQGAGHGLRVGRHFRFPEHDRHFRQRHHRSAGLRRAGDRLRHGGPKELVGIECERLGNEIARRRRFRASHSRTGQEQGEARGNVATSAPSVVDRSWPGAFRKFWAATEI